MDAMIRTQAEQLARQMATEATSIDDLNGLMKAMMKAALERMLNSEMEHHLNHPPAIVASPSDTTTSTPSKPTEKNRRNGHSQKTISSDMGEIELKTPRDRNSSFEPRVIAKHQRRITGFDDKILALYSKGMTTRDIQDLVQELYGVNVSPTLISEITSDLDAEVTAWRTRRLDAVYPIVYLDGIVVHVRGDHGRVSQQTMHVALEVNL